MSTFSLMAMPPADALAIIDGWETPTDVKASLKATLDMQARREAARTDIVKPELEGEAAQTHEVKCTVKVMVSHSVTSGGVTNIVNSYTEVLVVEKGT